MKNPVLVSLSTVPPIPCFISFHLIKLQGKRESRVNLIKEKRSTGNRWNEWKVMETRTGASFIKLNRAFTSFFVPLPLI